jgi:hypothetical protein
MRRKLVLLMLIRSIPEFGKLLSVQNAVISSDDSGHRKPREAAANRRVCDFR